jgi:NAD(P)-dependent dehydrogenase (short-subunit alcohol dehydrogenase family)
MNDRRVLVTGGSKGIGAAVARWLAEAGAAVVLVARGREALEATRAELAGERHEAHVLDVSDETGWRSLAGALGELDGLVCAAAVLDPIGPVGTYEPGHFRRALDVNVVGTLLAVHHCLPALRSARGAIVTFSGGGAAGPLPRYDAYAASKAAVARLSENLAIELAPAGVRVNCVAPGFVATGMHEATLAAGPAAVGPEYFERTERELAAGGFPAAEAAELVCLLLGDREAVPFSGKLISARWDPWREPAYRERLAADRDLATLRRIDGVLFAPVSGESGG